jgi:hypothetical protein
MKELIGCFLKIHSLPSDKVIELILKSLKSKNLEYIKKGPQKASINNLMVFDEKIYIKKYDFNINISSKGIIIGKIKPSNKKIILWFLRFVSEEIDNVVK